MLDYIEVNLMPIGLKKQMRVIKIVGIYAAIGTVVLLLAMGMAGFFHDLTTGIIFSSLFLLIMTPLSIPGVAFEKISQSTVRFADDQIYVLDKNGVCWRTIIYSAITAVCVEEISGFFYGQNKETYRNKYICVFLNGSSNIPDVSFAKLFVDKDFIMFGYHPEALRLLEGKMSSTGDGSVTRGRFS